MASKDLHLSLFQNHQAYSSKPVSIDEIMRLIRYDNYVKQLTAVYRDMAHRVSRKAANSEIKEKQMPGFSVAVLFNGTGKQLSNIAEFTGLCFCDIDHVENIDEAFEKCKNDPHTFMLYTTLSKEGLRVIYTYCRADGEAHLNAVPYAAAFRKGNDYYSKLTGVAVDKECANVNRISGMAHDPNAYLNTEAVPFVINDDEMLEDNFSPGKDPGKERKEYTQGSQSAEVLKAWPIVQQMMDRRDISYGAGTHHDYVLHATYIFNRFGCPENELKEWAAQEWADYEAAERNRCISWIYSKRQTQHGTWRLNRSDKRGEVSMITIEEICTWLISHKIELTYNVVTDQTHYKTPKSDGWQPMNNRALDSLRCTIAKETGKRVLKQDVADVIHSDYARLVHPVRDYLSCLPVWDGKDYVADLAARVKAMPVRVKQTDAEAQDYLNWALHKWLAAAVASWSTDGLANQTILTFIGAQGIYKTTFFRFLLPPSLRSYFYENTRNSFSTKDDHITLSENCFVEIEEVDVSRERDLSELKSIATSTKIKERRPYRQFPEEMHRLASLCATGNTEEFLIDETGNRRWLCIKVKQIDDPHEWNLNYDQLYAQLKHELAHGYQFYFDSKEQQRVEQQNEHFRVVSDEEQLITTRFRKPTHTDSETKLLKPASIAQMISYGRPAISTRKVGQVMRRLGYKWSHTLSGTVYHVVEIPVSEVNARLSYEISCNNTDNQIEA